MKGMLFLFLIAMIILLVIAIKALKKTKLKQKKELFTRTIRECVKSYEEKKDFWRMLYKLYGEDVIISEKDELLETILEVKKQYKKALKDLVQISENNTVLFSTQEEWDELDTKIDFLQRDQKISDDIIKTLPYLSKFIEVHKVLVLDIYKYLNGIAIMDGYVWSGLAHYDYESESSEFLRQTFQEQIESCRKLMLSCYRNYVQDEGWKLVCKTAPRFNTPSDCRLFKQICEDDDEVYEEWVKIWYSCFQDIAVEFGYSPLCIELHNWLKEINEEFGNPAWLEYPAQKFSTHFSYSSFSIIDINEIDSQELSRIRNLYIKGVIKGEYSKYKDPKYAN